MSIHSDTNSVGLITNLEQTLSKVKGYNPDWLTMITSKPVLFEDPDYMRVCNYINNTVTESELTAYQNGELTKIYANFETLLMCNLKYYDRIISWCTMYFHNYFRDHNDDIVVGKVPEHVVDFDITPTKIWCATMMSSSSTKWEIEYGYDIQLSSFTEFNSDVYNHLTNKSMFFSTFVAYRSYMCDTNGYRNTLIADSTSDDKLHKVCKKFTNGSGVIGMSEMDQLEDYVDHINKHVKRLRDSLYEGLSALYNGDSSVYSVFVFVNEFLIHTTHFAMRVFKTVKKQLGTNNTIQTISKDYTANSYECFVAEKELSKSNIIRKQIEWGKYETPTQYQSIINTLKVLLDRLVKTDYRRVIAYKRMDDKHNTHSVISLSGVFNNLYVKQRLYHAGKFVSESVLCMGKDKTVDYIINNGYYVFGYKDDVNTLINRFNKSEDNSDEQPVIYRFIDELKEHYNKYCIDLQEFMKPVVNSYNQNNLEIIDAYINGVDESKLSNKILTTNIKGITMMDTMNISKMVNTKSSKIDDIKTYWKIIQNQ